MRLFNKSAFVLFMVFLLGCTRNSELSFSQPRERLPSARGISEGITLQFVPGTENFRYEVEESNSGKRIASAESAITQSDFVDGLFRGTQDIINIPGGSFVVREDVSDAATAVRYIYFDRADDGTINVSYLDMPLYSRISHGLPTEAPYIVAKNRKIWSLMYLPSQKKINIDVDKITKSPDALTVR